MLQVTAATPSFIEIADVSVVSGQRLPEYTLPDPAIGSQIASFRAKSYTGEDVLIEPDGTARLFGFFAHWCEFCQAELPVVSDWLAETVLPSNVDVIAVSVSVIPSADNFPPSDWFSREGFSGTVLVDDDGATLQETFGVQAYPFWVAVDEAGIVVERTTGNLTPAQLDQLIQRISS